MSDKIHQNQSLPPHNMAMNGWTQQWQNLQNPFAQARSFSYWPQWGAQYSMNMTPVNGVISHPVPFQSMNIENYGFPPQIDQSSVPSNYNESNCSSNASISSSIGFENAVNKINPPLPGNSPKNKPGIEEGLKSIENPDKIPLPDGPPPSVPPFPPLPPSNNANIHSHPSFFNVNSQPIKFNLNQNKSFIPFNLPNKKNRRKKNKNQTTVSHNPLFINSASMNFPSTKIFNTNSTQNTIMPSLALKAQGITENQQNMQENACTNKSNGTDVSSIPLMQHPQASHDDWPPSLLEYIKRCYLKCESSIDKDQVGIILKGKITTAMSSNTLFTKNWDAEPLPNLRGKKIDQCHVNNAGNGVSITAFRARNKFGDALKNRLGKNRNYRGSNKTSLSKCTTHRNFKSRSKSRSESSDLDRDRSNSESRSRTRSRSRSRSRSSSAGSRKKKRNSDSNSSNDNGEFLLKLKPEKKNSRKSKKKQKRQGSFYSDISFGETESVSTERLQQRAARFKETLEAPRANKKPIVVASSINTMAYEDTDGDFEYNDLHIVGTCQDLEKPFLRLTSAPEASQVRPIKILEKSLELIKAKWLETADYRYTCEQLKSIRQDLTVQGIRNDFTVKVYETHARICLEKGDPEEFNQCQTQLRMLYSDLGGDNQHEFAAYRILYYIYTRNTLDLTIGIGSLKAEEKEDECVKHALQVAHAWCMNNYHRFFWLYQCSPKMSSYLIDWFIERERKSALKTMIKAYRQSLPVVFVAEKLGFESVEKFLAFTTAFNLAYCDVERSKIDCKASMASISCF